MSNEQIFEQIKAVSAVVLASEARIDSSLAATARMVAEAIDAHARVGVPAYAVQPVLDHLADAFNTQLASRRHIGLAHAEFGRTAKRLGVSAEDYGDWWPCPSFPTPPSSTATVHTLAAAA